MLALLLLLLVVVVGHPAKLGATVPGLGVGSAFAYVFTFR